MSLTINGTVIKTPTKFNIERFPLTKAGRVASGNMTAELIGWKRKFNLEYSSIYGEELDIILGVLIGTNFFFNFGYVENGVQKSARCYVGGIPSDLMRSDIWQWTDVKFSLIEQ